MMTNQAKKNIRLSLIIPVFNRPDEVNELLESLLHQSDRDFEIIIVEDGSTEPCIEQIKKYSNDLNIQYLTKPNSGPGLSRNFGAIHATGNYYIFLDSDCIIPPEYITCVKSNLEKEFTDAFGGPDSAHEKFTKFQKAINYSMTSFLTTGGIRGKSEKIEKFYPRSFNMGYSKEVFEKTEGFSSMRFGEDIDMSIRIIKTGYQTKLFKNAFVYHKRRSNPRQFFKQVFNSGIARINLFKQYPESLKIVHFFPALFILFLLITFILSLTISLYFFLPFGIYFFIILIDSSIQYKHPIIGIITIIVVFIQQLGYGTGFIKAFWRRVILKKEKFNAFEKNFYK